MKSALTVLQVFSQALPNRDLKSLLYSLYPDFGGHGTEGLPNRSGGTYRGLRAMRGMWRGWGEAFALRPEPAQFLIAEDDDVVVHGRDSGKSIASQKPTGQAFTSEVQSL